MLVVTLAHPLPENLAVTTLGVRSWKKSFMIMTIISIIVELLLDIRILAEILVVLTEM